MRRGVLTSVVMILLTLTFAGKGAAQTVQLASRGPRFLAVSPGSTAPVDASGAAVLHRRVSLSMQGATIEAALTEVTQQADLELMYTKAVIPAERPVTVQATDITVAAALTETLLQLHRR